MNSIKYYLYYFESKFIGYPFVIRVTLFLIVILVLIYLGSMVRILFIAKKRNQFENRKKQIKEEYETKLNQVLFSEKNLSSQEIEKQLNINSDPIKEWGKSYISKLILSLINQDMKLNVRNYKQTLKVFELHAYWEDQLRNKNVKDEGTALRILDDMSEDASSNAISNKTGSQNDNLRKHAKSIFMKFDSNDAFKFLEDDFDKDFNSLDEVRIHDALKDKSKSRTLPPLIRWVNTAKNEFFKSFLIQEIGYFKQIDCAEKLIEIFKEPLSNNLVKSQIAKTLGVMDYKAAIPHLIEGYESNTQEVQESVIHAMGSLRGQDALAFLEKIYHETHNKETLIKVLQNIYLVDESKIVFNKLKSTSTTDFEKSIFDYIDQGFSVR